MAQPMQITELWRYPVKSMGGERLSTAEVTDLGIAGDRGWGVFDTETGNVLTARRAPELLFASAKVVDGEVEVAIPDGPTVGAAAADAALSTWLGRPVELRRAGDEGGTYENPMDPFNDTDWVSWTGPGGAWHDSTRSRVSIVSTTTLGDWDIRRFRTNVVVTGEGEDHLVGQAIRLGSDVVVDVTKRIDRCVMVTRPQPGLARDLDLLKSINRDRASCLSIGATVRTAGSVAIADSVVTESAM